MVAEKILLVDNISRYRDSVKDFLELYGYQVLTASNPDSALSIVQGEMPSLAVIDIRLRDDADDKDDSGLTLAKQMEPSLPKIILTAFPSYQAVRESLAPLDGLPAAAGFVAKQEGLPKLLTTIRDELARHKPSNGQKALGPFEALAKTSGNGLVKRLEPREVASRVQENEAALEEELAVALDRENSRISQWHQARLIAGVAGIVLIVTAIVALLSGASKPGLVSMAASIITNIINALFSKPQDQAHLRERELYEQLAAVRADRRLLSLCDTLEDAKDREEYRKKMIDHILQQHSRPAPKSRKGGRKN